jgi:hypothetical protein
VSKEQILRCSGFVRRWGYETLETWVHNLEKEATHSFTNTQLFCLLGFCGNKGYDVTKLAVRSLSLLADVNAIGECVELIATEEQEYQNLLKEKAKIEETKQQLLIENQQKKK